jgi:hypothetical protein
LKFFFTSGKNPSGQIAPRQRKTKVEQLLLDLPAFPNLRGEILIELRSDSDFDSTARDQYLKVEPAFSIGLSEHFSIEAGFVLEPVANPPPGRDRWFDDEGFFVETLFLRWEWDRFSLHAGKFNPAFGFAWGLAPGIYGVDFAEDYEITERIGFGGTIEFGDAAVGRHRLGTDVAWRHAREDGVRGDGFGVLVSYVLAF